MWRWRTPTTHPLPASVLSCGSLTQCRLGSSAMSRRATCDPIDHPRFVRSEFRLMRIPCEHASCTPGTPYPQSAVARNRKGNRLGAVSGSSRPAGRTLRSHERQSTPESRSRSRPHKNKKARVDMARRRARRTTRRRSGSRWAVARLGRPCGSLVVDALLEQLGGRIVLAIDRRVQLCVEPRARGAAPRRCCAPPSRLASIHLDVREAW
mmetsp:Transcript_49130/g.151127  ORF Transcript_49130/g.151127 Transcript_49130/m.151127 type:complete len:209 (+) Transcript_49130:550-1176(+)